jgi:3'(2'), 5'-bisphosphate nucleotidase
MRNVSPSLERSCNNPDVEPSQRPLSSSTYTRLHLPPSPSPPDSLKFLESVEAGHSAHTVQARIGELLGATKNSSLRMDSQAKYGCLGRGEGGA